MTLFELHLFGFTLAPTWYGLMYAIGFLGGYFIVRSRRRFTDKELDDLLLFVFIGVIVGGRLGYVIFYNFPYYLNHLMEVLFLWKGGMSFHGGMIGVILALIYFSRKYKKSLLLIGDEVTSILPIGLGAGRIGNYLNGELLGFSGYTGPLAIMRNGIPHFPTPILEASLEGVILGGILYMTYKYRRFTGQVSAMFLVAYGIVRLFAELTRLPDEHIGYLFGTEWVTLGMLLTLPMIVSGIIVWILACKNQDKG